MNKYDDVVLDIPAILNDFRGRETTAPNNKGRHHYGCHLFKKYFHLILWKSGLLKRLIFSNLKLNWFDEFNNYWVKRLYLRPLSPPDFWFLFGTYRQKFQNLQLASNENSIHHSEIWKNPNTIFLLFHNQLKLYLNPIASYRFKKYIKNNSRILEYGCGIAPIANSILRLLRNTS